LRSAVARTVRRWEERTGFTFARSPQAAFVFATDASAASLVIDCTAAGSALPTLGEDESYTLDASATQIVLRAPNVVGALRGLETLLQLLQRDTDGWFVPKISIHDQPRFPWRGLMIDVCRHWQPMDVIKRNLDGMALVKLNVLHLHLTEDQGFRIESKTHPRLHELGSDGKYFTQDEIREIIAYAAERGIRVVPEFDIPGHATSWLVAYPELGSAPGPYTIERKWGIFDPVLDPTNEDVYVLLADFLGEMAELFPDPYLHIGGDENNGKHWNANARIQNFIREQNLHDNEGIHAYFNRRIRDILAPHGKKIVGWDEILHPDIPQDAVIHSWRGPAGLVDAAKRGYSAILSNGYYIDLCYPAADHYRNDPLPADT
ncbi:MAG TPA: family 20 glycosylhydrolase, partial [Opitutus sp.]|nr:family 20 glycosylhydrolase [Opitutus sp.]